MVFPFYYDLYRFLGGKYRDIIDQIIQAERAKYLKSKI